MSCSYPEGPVLHAPAVVITIQDRSVMISSLSKTQRSRLERLTLPWEGIIAEKVLTLAEVGSREQGDGSDLIGATTSNLDAPVATRREIYKNNKSRRFNMDFFGFIISSSPQSRPSHSFPPSSLSLS